MKKINFLLTSAIIALVIAFAFVIVKGDKHSFVKFHKIPFPTNGVTLNGLTFDQANQLITNFYADNTASDNKIDIWLSKKWVDTVDSILAREKDDGLRIYLAKRNDGKNTVVIVSTQKDIGNPHAESLYDHSDYYTHNSAFLKTADAALQEDYNGNIGATLFYKPDFTGIICDPTAVNYIDYQEAYKDVINFTQQKPGQGINTNSEWFPIEMLDNIKADLASAIKHNVPADGIRLYFAKNIPTCANQNHKYKTCLIIVTTYANTVSVPGTLTHFDYYKCFPDTSHLAPKDNGEECPNNCNDVTLPQ